MWDNNLDAADIINHGGDVRFTRPDTGANVDGQAAIIALGNAQLLKLAA